jgi:hypothetical protein
MHATILLQVYYNDKFKYNHEKRIINLKIHKYIKTLKFYTRAASNLKNMNGKDNLLSIITQIINQVPNSTRELFYSLHV